MIKECKIQANKNRCNCSYPGCSKKGYCCDCLSYHISSRELPACFFPAAIERTYDRSFERFASLVQSGAI